MHPASPQACPILLVPQAPQVSQLPQVPQTPRLERLAPPPANAVPGSTLPQHPATPASGGSTISITPVSLASVSPDPADDVFREALKRHEQGLSLAHRKAFHDASAIGLIGVIKQLNEQHNAESSVRKAAVKVQGFLQVVDGYLTAVSVLIQHNPDISALVVGGLRLFVDVREMVSLCLFDIR